MKKRSEALRCYDCKRWIGAASMAAALYNKGPFLTAFGSVDYSSLHENYTLEEADALETIYRCGDCYKKELNKCC